MSVLVAGLGLATPARSIKQEDAATVAHSMIGDDGSHERALRRLFEKSGVLQRGSVLLEPPGDDSYRQSFYPPAETEQDRGPTTAQRILAYSQYAAPLAKQACERALSEAAQSVEGVTHLVTVSCTGFESPGVDFQLIERLRLSPDVARTNIGFMGCHGAFNGMRVAQAFAQADENAVVLLCCIELCSLHCIYGYRPQQIVAGSLFADGAAAMVVRQSSEEEPSPTQWRMRALGSRQLPDSQREMTWTVGDHGFEMTLSPEVPRAIRAQLAPYMSHWLGQFGLTADDIGCWAIHPGGPRIIEAAAQALSLNESQTQPSFDVLARHGNMSSPTILFVVDQLRRAGAARPCVAMAFGPGLVVESALFV